MVEKILKNARIPLVVIGCALVFMSVRYLGGNSFQNLTMILGGVAFAAALFFALILSRPSSKRNKGEANSYKYALVWKVLITLGAGLAVLYYHLLGTEAEPQTAGLKILLALWLLFLIFGFFLGLGTELAIKEFGFGANAEPKRVKLASLSWLLAGFSLAIVIAINFIGVQFNTSVDWSYTKVTKPSEGTINAVRTLDGPLNVYVYYPRRSEVLRYVKEYFTSVQQHNKSINIIYTDKDLEPVLAEQLKVRDNGFVVLSKSEDPAKGDAKKINIGLTIASARKNLAKLDESFRSSFIAISQKAKFAYFTVGHGENTWQGERDPLRSINAIYDFLKSQNYRIETLSIQNGSMEKVPDNASLLVTLGPTSPFAPEEVKAIDHFLSSGGKYLVALDVNAPGEAVNVKNLGEDPLLAMLSTKGIDFRSQVLSDEQQFARATGGKNDRWFIFSNVFTSHEAVRNLSRFDTQLALLFYRSGYFDINKNNPDWQVSELIKSMASNYVDTNENFAFDPNETKGTRILGAAIEKKMIPPTGTKDSAPDISNQGRIVALSDASVFADVLLANSRGNQLLAFELFNWISGTPELSGALESEEDVKIILKQNEQLAFYYGTLFIPPLLVFSIGVIVLNMRRNRHKRRIR